MPGLISDKVCFGKMATGMMMDDDGWSKERERRGRGQKNRDGKMNSCVQSYSTSTICADCLVILYVHNHNLGVWEFIIVAFPVFPSPAWKRLSQQGRSWWWC